MVDIDIDIKEKFVKNRLLKLQEAVLRMDIDISSSSDRLEQLRSLKKKAEEEIVALRQDMVRLLAHKEEMKNK